MRLIQQDIYIAGVPIGEAELREISQIAGGYTIIQTGGGWVDEHGELVSEDAYILRTIAEGSWRADMVQEVAAGWAASVGESAIMVTRQLVTTRMVRP